MQPICNAATRRRLLAKLVREVMRTERRAIAIGHAHVRGASLPGHALAGIADHAEQLAPRFAEVVAPLALRGSRTRRLADRLAAWRLRAIELRAADAFRRALDELHHAIDVVRVLRDVARLAEQFSLIRWCDDWLAVRRPMVAAAAASRLRAARHRHRGIPPRSLPSFRA